MTTPKVILYFEKVIKETDIPTATFREITPQNVQLIALYDI